jgi:hypothetical protein
MLSWQTEPFRRMAQKGCSKVASKIDQTLTVSQINTRSGANAGRKLVEDRQEVVFRAE